MADPLSYHYIFISFQKPYECRTRECTRAFTTSACRRRHELRVHQVNQRGGLYVPVVSCFIHELTRFSLHECTPIISSCYHSLPHDVSQTRFVFCKTMQTLSQRVIKGTTYLLVYHGISLKFISNPY